MQEDGEDQVVEATVYPKGPNQKNNGTTQQVSSQGTTEEINSSNNKSYKSSILRRFDFSSQLQRMSVISKNSFDQ
jgi:magnesium-transporting ATPase (P-type)